MQPIRPQDAASVYQRQVVQGAEAGQGPDASRRAGRTDAAGGGTRRADRVTVSRQAQELYRAMQAVGQQDDVRADRVEALRAQITGGTYRVDAQGIAERLAEGGFNS
jgi:negative regulator of flagellin synthesis FlgM